MMSAWMSTRGRASVILSILLIAWVSVAQDLRTPMELQELSAGISYLRPGLGDFDVYRDGWGLELQYRWWFHEVHGLAFSFGAERWETDGDSLDWGAPPSGSLSLWTAGLSWVGLLYEDRANTWTVEAGLRYHFADSDVRIRVGDRDFKVDIDDGLTGVLALGYERRLSESVSAAVTLSYQADLSTGEASFEGHRLRSNKLEAWGLQLGLRRRW